MSSVSVPKGASVTRKRGRESHGKPVAFRSNIPGDAADTMGLPYENAHPSVRKVAPLSSADAVLLAMHASRLTDNKFALPTVLYMLEVAERIAVADGARAVAERVREIRRVHAAKQERATR